MARTNKAVPTLRRAPALAADMADLVRGFKSMFDPYRPELHYMRGPGPAWHAKHAAVADTAPDFAPSILQVRG